MSRITPTVISRWNGPSDGNAETTAAVPAEICTATVTM